MITYPGHSQNNFPEEEPSLADRFHLYLHKTRGLDFCAICGNHFFSWEMERVEKELEFLKQVEELNASKSPALSR